MLWKLKALDLIYGEPPPVQYLEGLKNPLTPLSREAYKRTPLYYKYQMTLHINGWRVSATTRRQYMYAHLRAFVWIFVAIIWEEL